uniref:Sodium channel regulatory subunit beta-4 n=1 Tax=Cavia porcellus TaxID=10141 RepID=H0V1S8_CAVPO
MSRTRDRGKALARWLGTGLLGLLLLPVSLSLEVSVGKATTIYAVNGTEILLPCTFSSCFGFEDLRFWWSYNSSDTSRILIDGTVKNEKSDPKLKLKDDDRITLVGTTKEKKNNISILLRDLEFSDSGKYTCHVRNPKEKDLEHQATIILQVVDKKECLVSSSGNDNTENGLPGSKAEEKPPTKV